jgi:chemotaxis methyl-accepting protein methylase
MNEAVSHAARYRHVTFPDSVGGYGKAVNLSPPPPFDPLADAGPSPAAPTEPLAPDVESFLRWLLSRAGLNIRHYKPETLGRRLPACLRALRVGSVGQARALLQRQPQLASAALDALLIGVTGFFRDDAVFSALHRRTLPDLLRRWRAQAGSRSFRVWSAGCSDGAELYTVAILLVELGALSPFGVELVGTDCRPEALERAAAGAFDAAAVKSVPPHLLQRYFSFDGSRHHVQRALRAAVRWRCGDALAAPEPGPWDLVLCRNVAIYLQPESAAALWASLAAVLRPGGALVLGTAERPNGVPGLSCEAPCVYRRADGPPGRPAPARRPGDSGADR